MSTQPGDDTPQMPRPDQTVNTPPPWDRPPSQPVNPWRVVGWLVAIFLVLILIGAFVTAHHQPTCPAGYTWDPSIQQCVYQ